MPSRVSTYLKARTQRRLRDEVVKAKSRQRSRIKGGKRQKIYSVIEGKQCTLLNNVLYRFVFKKKQTVILIKSLWQHKQLGWKLLFNISIEL